MSEETKITEKKTRRKVSFSEDELRNLITGIVQEELHEIKSDQKYIEKKIDKLLLNQN